MVQELDARQTFSARLHQALGALGLPVRGRATWLHERTGLSKKAAGKWLNAEAMPETKRIEGLAKLLNVDARWLLSGQGVAPEDDNKQPSRQTTTLPARLHAARLARRYEVADAARVTGVTPERWEAWERGEDLPPPPRLAIIAGALGVPLHELTGGEPSHANVVPVVRNPFATSRRIPLVSSVQAGNWTEVRGHLPEDVKWLEAEDVSPDAFAVKVEGDSMEPAFPEGTTLIVDPAARTQDMINMIGRYVIARLPDTNEATFKRLVRDAGRYMLKAINPAYPIIFVTGECEIVGVVVQARQDL